MEQQYTLLCQKLVSSCLLVVICCLLVVGCWLLYAALSSWRVYGTINHQPRTTKKQQLQNLHRRLDV